MCPYVRAYIYRYVRIHINILRKRREMEEDDHLLTCYCFKCLLQVYTLHQYLAELQLK